MQRCSHSPEWTLHKPDYTGFCSSAKKKKKIPDLEKLFFDSGSLLTAFRIFLQVIKVIKLHDKKNSEMVVNRPLARLHRLSPYILCSYTICAVALVKFNPPSAPAFYSELPYSPQPARQRCLSIPVYPMSWSQPNI